MYNQNIYYLSIDFPFLIPFSNICVGDYFSVMFQHLTEHVTRDLALNSFVNDIL